MKVQIVKVEDFLKVLEHIISSAEKQEAEVKNSENVQIEPVHMELSYYFENIAKKLNCNYLEVARWLDKLTDVYPAAALSIMLREIALVLDSKYKDHIQDSEKVYVVSLLDGRIHEANKKHIKNYRNFAAFRTMEDAKLACRILRTPLKAAFKSGKQKD